MKLCAKATTIRDAAKQRIARDLEYAETQNDEGRPQAAVVAVFASGHRVKVARALNRHIDRCWLCSR